MLASIPLLFPTIDDSYVYLIGLLCLPILLVEFYTAARYVALSFYNKLDRAPPWDINKIAVLFYPRHYRNHGRIKLIPRHPTINYKRLLMSLLPLLTKGTLASHTHHTQHPHTPRQPTWASSSPDPFTLTYYDVHDSFDDSWDPSSIMKAFHPHPSPPLIDWGSPSEPTFQLHQVDLEDLFSDDYDPSSVVAMLRFGLTSRTLIQSEAPVHFSMLENPSCYSSMIIDKQEPPLVVDTGASTSISPKRSDFLTYRESFMSIRDLSSSNTVHGEGLVQWNVIDTAGNEVSLIVEGCHIPKAEVRLLSPQCLLQRDGGHSLQTTEKLTITLDTGKTMDAHYCPRSKLPCLKLATALTRACMKSLWTSTFAFATKEANKFTTVLSEDNTNINAGQKEAVLLHQRLSHACFKWIQPLMRDRKWLRDRESSDASFRSGSFIPCSKRASTCDVRGLKCISCECAKAHRRSSRKRRPQQFESDTGERSLKNNHTVPGACISADHYLSPIEGRLYNTFGRE
jgi:hypothetical protein